MSRDERLTWVEAAHKALAHLDCDTLTRASQAAMLKADHPSKLVPLIAAEAERLTQGYRPMSTIIPIPHEPEPPETPEQRAERLEIGAMMRNLVQKLEANAA